MATVSDVCSLPAGAGQLYFSAESNAYDDNGVGRDIELTALGVVARPGTNNAQPVRVAAGDLADVARRHLGPDAELIQRAASHRGGTNAIVEHRTAGELYVEQNYIWPEHDDRGGARTCSGCARCQPQPAGHERRRRAGVSAANSTPSVERAEQLEYSVPFAGAVLAVH